MLHLGFEGDPAGQIHEKAVTAARVEPRPHRSGWIDAARGIGIILVVLAHAERGIVEAGMKLPMPATDIADATIYTFHMPLFFLLAGWHVPRGLAVGRTLFLRDRLATILWPYFLWATIYIGINMMVTSVNQPMTLADLASLPWQPVAHFWFLYALFLCNLLAAAIWPRRWLLLPATLALVAAVLAWGPRTIVLQAAQYVPFFALGMALGRAGPARDPWLHRIALPLLITGFAVLLVNRLMAAPSSPFPPGNAPIYYLGAFGGIAGVIGLSLRIGERARWLRRIGQASMAIYVLHIFVSAGSRIIVMHFGPPVDPIALLLASSVAAILLPWLAYEFLGRRGLTTALGLGKFVHG